MRNVQQVGLNGKVFSAEMVDELTDQLDYKRQGAVPGGQSGLHLDQPSCAAFQQSVSARYQICGTNGGRQAGAICQKMDPAKLTTASFLPSTDCLDAESARQRCGIQSGVLRFSAGEPRGRHPLCRQLRKATGRHLADNKEVTDYLNQNHVNVKPYDEIYSHLAQLVEQQPDALFMLDRKMNNAAIASLLPDENLVDEDSPVAILKAVKNETENRRTAAGAGGRRGGRRRLSAGSTR